MRLNLSNVQFSKKDIRLDIKLPKYLTAELAYLIGVHIGDGTLVSKPNECHYVIGYTGHLIDEYYYHKNVLIPLIKKLFNKKVHAVEDKRERKTSVRTYFNSKAIFTFLSNVIKLPIGDKSNCTIPYIIKISNREVKINFIKGLADTDGTLVFKKRYRKLHYYPTISLASKSRTLIKEVNNILKKEGFSTSFKLDYLVYDRKRNVNYIRSFVELNGLDNLNLWMDKIGFKSEKHLTKYEVWKKLGYCPANTNINQRIEILHSLN